jgi:hypothetical protein
MAAWLDPADYPGICIDCWEVDEKCKCLDLTEYDEVADEVWEALRKLEDLTRKKGYNVRTKYVEQKLAEHRNSVIWMHAHGFTEEA